MIVVKQYCRFIRSYSTIVLIGDVFHTIAMGIARGARDTEYGVWRHTVVPRVGDQLLTELPADGWLSPQERLAELLDSPSDAAQLYQALHGKLSAPAPGDTSAAKRPAAATASGRGRGGRPRFWRAKKS